MLVAGSSPGVFAGLAARSAASPAKTPGEEPATSILKTRKTTFEKPRAMDRWGLTRCGVLV